MTEGLYSDDAGLGAGGDAAIGARRDAVFGDERRAPEKKSGLLLGIGIGLAIGCGGMVALVIGALAVFGIFIEAGVVPDTLAIPGDELEPATLEFLLEESIVEPDEQVLYFYSDGVFSLREDGNLFTDRRVNSYWEDEDELEIDEASYPEIETIEPWFSDSWLEPSIITITLLDAYIFDLYVSNEEGRDEDFHELLVETWQANR